MFGGYQEWSDVSCCTVCLPAIGCLALSSSRRLFLPQLRPGPSLRGALWNFLSITAGDDEGALLLFGVELLDSSSMPRVVRSMVLPPGNARQGVNPAGTLSIGYLPG